MGAVQGSIPGGEESFYFGAKIGRPSARGPDGLIAIGCWRIQQITEDPLRLDSQLIHGRPVPAEYTGQYRLH